MVGDVYSRKSLSGFLMTFVGGCLLAIQVAKMCCIIQYKAEYNIIEGCKEAL